ncbi:hypothetical protein ACSVDA_21425 [Cytobacillus sp. Hm23]
MSNTRYVALHKGKSLDREKLAVVTVYETGISKQQVKADNQYSKQWGLLVQAETEAEWVRKI